MDYRSGDEIAGAFHFIYDIYRRLRSLQFLSDERLEGDQRNLCRDAIADLLQLAETEGEILGHLVHVSEVPTASGLGAAGG